MGCGAAQTFLFPCFLETCHTVNEITELIADPRLAYRAGRKLMLVPIIPVEYRDGSVAEADIDFVAFKFASDFRSQLGCFKDDFLNVFRGRIV